MQAAIVFLSGRPPGNYSGEYHGGYIGWLIGVLIIGCLICGLLGWFSRK